MQAYHLTKSENAWSLHAENSERAVLHAPTKESALTQAIAYLQKNSGSLVDHREDGQIEEERTYPRSQDPRKSPG